MFKYIVTNTGLKRLKVELLLFAVESAIRAHDDHKDFFWPAALCCREAWTAACQGIDSSRVCHHFSAFVKVRQVCTCTFQRV